LFVVGRSHESRRNSEKAVEGIHKFVEI